MYAQTKKEAQIVCRGDVRISRAIIDKYVRNFRKNMKKFDKMLL